MTDEKKSILFIKYLPTIMALTCALKIFLFYHDLYVPSHYINIILNAVIVIGGIFCGKLYGLSYKHRLIGYIALFGYAIYIIIYTFNLEHAIVHWFTVFFLLFVFIITILYRKL